jgi:hypothetical protein
VRDPRDAALTYAIWDAHNTTRLEDDDHYLEIEPFARDVRRWLAVQGWELVRIKPVKKRRAK